MKREVPLYELIYLRGRESPHLKVARAVGFAGCTPEELKAKLDIPPGKHRSDEYGIYQRAVTDLTRWLEREGPDVQKFGGGRLVLSERAVKSCQVLLGPPPGTPEHTEYWAKVIFQSGMLEPHVPGKEEAPPATPEVKATRGKPRAKKEKPCTATVTSSAKPKARPSRAARGAGKT